MVQAVLGVLGLQQQPLLHLQQQPMVMVAEAEALQVIITLLLALVEQVAQAEQDTFFFTTKRKVTKWLTMQL